jgi:signal transduction histidine kinase
LRDKSTLDRAAAAVPGTEFNVEHLELVTAKLHEKVGELEATRQHKSEFLASMSHELRTQLGAILGFSELLTDATPGRFDDQTRNKFLAEINSSGRYLMALINDILDLSKLEAGQMVFQIENVLVADVVRSVLSAMEPIAKKKAIRLVTYGAAHIQVPADAGKLTQMLFNLVSNALKFTPAGGCVTVGARRLAGAVEISVSDTGIGIAEADREHLFDEFPQLDSTIARQQHGTGLRLALTKRFVELHGGTISVASEVGKGSVFTLTLPLNRERRQHIRRRAGGDDRRSLMVVGEKQPLA